MPRYVLLGLAGRDVDVLSRLSRVEPRPEVLVVHPDPGALILRLADVAQLPALTEPPRPRADDVLVVPSTPQEEVADWVRSWRDVGARIILPEGVQSNVDTPSPVRAAVSAQAAAAASASSAMTAAHSAHAAPGAPSTPPQASASTAMESTGSNGSDHAMPAVPAETPDVPAEAAAAASAPPEPVVPLAPPAEPPAAPSSRVELAPGSAEVWESPEATFRYLAEQAVGRDTPVTLWWNGGVDAWVPWVWTGASAGARPQEPGDALKLHTSCGEFRVSGAAGRRDRFHMAALTRVAEDMALRDLSRWRREARALAARGLPDPHADQAALAGWVAPVLAALEVSSALFWRREGGGWRLVHAHGEGLGFDGSLVMPAPLFAATFESETSPWRRWEPVAGLRAHLELKSDDPRWPLRLRRVELALAGEETAW